MEEEEFIRQIDCNFPYGAPDEARRLIAVACSISANAAFTVVHELALAPQRLGVDKGIRLGFLEELNAQFNHPLKSMVLDVARRVIMGEALSTAEVLAGMRQIEPYPDQLQALAMLEQSASDVDDASVPDEYQRIVEAWGARRNCSTE